VVPFAAVSVAVVVLVVAVLISSFVDVTPTELWSSLPLSTRTTRPAQPADAPRAQRPL